MIRPAGIPPLPAGSAPPSARSPLPAGVAPLPARSVLLSVLLGSHPPRLAVRTLVRTAELFGITAGTARVALSRLAADGEVVAESGTYRLSERHLARQRDQDAAVRPPTRPWRGRWELLSSTAGGTDPVATDRRMAELVPSLWVRPDNLDRPRPELAAGTTLWTAAVDAGTAPPAALWDPDGWAATARALLAGLADVTSPADRLAVAAAAVRHIRTDPLLPAEMLPPAWPGSELRQAYDAYRAELGRLIAAVSLM